MFGGNLGVALGAAADEFNNQRRMAREDARDKREEEQFGWAREEQARKKRIGDEADAIMKEFNDLDTYYRGAEKIGDDQLGEYIKTGISRYNENPLYKNGMFANVSMVDGKPMIVHGNMAKLGGVQMMPVDRDTLRQGYESMRGMLMERLARTSPEAYQQHFYKERDFNLKGREVGAKETEVRQKGEYQQGILDWHDKQASRPQFMQDGTGRILAISPDAKLLGTFGSARPVTGGHGGAGKMPLTTQEQASLKSIMDRYAAETDPAKRAQIGQEYQMAQSYMLLNRGRVPNLPGGMVNNPKQALSPEEQKEYRKALVELGTRPEPNVGFFGTRNDEAGLKWDAAKAHLDKIYGVAAPKTTPEVTRDAPPGAKREASPSTAAALMPNRPQSGLSAAGLPMSSYPTRPVTHEPVVLVPLGGQGLVNSPTDIGYDLGPNLGLPRQLR